MSIQFDFLPKEYHQTNLRRRNVPWLVSMVLLVVLVGSGGLVVQMGTRRQLWTTYQQLTQQCMANEVKLAQYQHQKAKKRNALRKARLLQPILLGYPRSWLLEAIVSSTPEDVVLDQVRLTLKEEQQVTESQEAPVDFLRSGSGGSADKATEELIRAQEKLSRAWIEVVIDGRSVSTTAVQDFCSQLSHFPVIEEINLQTVEGMSNEKIGQGSTHFVLWGRCRHLPPPAAFVRPDQVPAMTTGPLANVGRHGSKANLP